MLFQTLSSIVGQSNGNWTCVVVGNAPLQLPFKDDRIVVRHVEFPPNQCHGMQVETSEDKERSWQSFRRDKGRRVKAGLEALGWIDGPRFVMVVDDDDLLHCDLVDWLSNAPTQSAGYVITRGYEWVHGSGWLYLQDQFDKRCGTSLIPALGSLELPPNPEQLPDEIAERWLGSHIFLRPDLKNRGKPLKPVPFRAAIYRLGNTNSNQYKSGHFSISLLKNPILFMDLLSRIKRMNKNLKEKFFSCN